MLCSSFYRPLGCDSVC